MLTFSDFEFRYETEINYKKNLFIEINSTCQTLNYWISRNQIASTLLLQKK